MKSISSAFLCILMLMVCACGNQGKDSTVNIAVNTDNGVRYFSNNKRTSLFNKQFEEVSKFSEGLAPIKQNGKWGYINTKGEVVIPCIYDAAWPFSEGLATVKKGRWPIGQRLPNGKYGFINTKGEVVIPCIYDHAWSFSEGLAKVLQNGKWSIINTEGKVIVAECDYWNTSWSVVGL